MNQLRFADNLQHIAVVDVHSFPLWNAGKHAESTLSQASGQQYSTDC